MICIFVCKFDENKEDILLDKMSLLSLKEKEHIERFRFMNDRALSFLGKAIFWCFADKYKDYKDGEVVFLEDYDFITKEIFKEIPLKYNELGKPFVDGRENLYFNISHSKNICVVAIGDENVGIDVQEKKAIKNDFAKRYYHAKDLAHIDMVEDKDSEIIRIWSMKESFVKYEGSGMAYGLSKFYSDYDNNLIVSNEGDILAKYSKVFEDDTFVCYISQKY